MVWSGVRSTGKGGELVDKKLSHNQKKLRIGHGLQPSSNLNILALKISYSMCVVCKSIGVLKTADCYVSIVTPSPLSIQNYQSR